MELHYLFKFTHRNHKRLSIPTSSRLTIIILIYMDNLKKYSKPLMIVEKFEPNHYCIPCNPPHQVVSYTLTDPYPSWQHFIMDSDGDQECTLVDLESGYRQTTDSGLHQQELTTHVAPEVCWPAKIANPTTLEEVMTDVPLWYGTDDHNQSGHVYAFETLKINYNQS